MPNVPVFFVPWASPETQEADYAGLAKFSGVAVPPLANRVYSIAFEHDGEHWTATVGKPLLGVRYRTVRTRGQEVERRDPLHDPAVVLAIFEGYPYKVVTDHRLVRNVGSKWENPFFVGEPGSVTRFATRRVGSSQDDTGRCAP